MLLTCRESRDVSALFFRLYPPVPLVPLLTYRHFQMRKKSPGCPSTKEAFPPRERTAYRSREIAPMSLPSRPGPVGPKLKTAISWESVEAGEESCGCREGQGIRKPERQCAGQEVACDLALNSILMRTKAPTAPTTKDFTTCSFLTAD
jgi:hypothetical protein